MTENTASHGCTMADLHCQISALAVATPGIGTLRRWLLQAAAETDRWSEPDAAQKTAAAPKMAITAANLRAFYDAHARQMIDAGALSACHCLSLVVAELEEMEAAVNLEEGKAAGEGIEAAAH